MKRLLQGLLASLLLLSAFLFCGCDSQDGDNASLYYSLMTDSQADAYAQKVYLIIPEDCSGPLSLKARELADAIEERTQVEALVKYDNEDIYIREDELPVLLGNTCYISSRDSMRLLRYGDYICKWDGSAIILGGRHDEATIVAVDKFISTVLTAASRASLMHKDAHFESISQYPVKQITLNGFDLYDYTLVYSGQNGLGEKELARILRDHIAVKSGYMLDMLSDDELDGAVGKTISVSGNKDTVGAVIQNRDNSIQMIGEGEYELSAAIAAFSKLLLDENNSNVSIERDIHIESRGNRLNICYNLISSNGESNIELIEKWTSRLNEQDYDVVILRAAPVWFLPYAEQECGEYEYIELPEIQGAVLYRRDKIDGITVNTDSGVLLAMNIKGESEHRELFLADGTEDAYEIGEYSASILNRELADTAVACVDEELIDIAGKKHELYLYVGDAIKDCGSGMDTYTFEGKDCKGAFVSVCLGVRYTEAFNILKDPEK